MKSEKGIGPALDKLGKQVCYVVEPAVFQLTDKSTLSDGDKAATTRL
jgi:hypothetical protein